MFQLPHSGQRPTHFEDWLPHSWQAKIVRGPLSVFTSGSNYKVGLRQLPVGVRSLPTSAKKAQQDGRLADRRQQRAGGRNHAQDLDVREAKHLDRNGRG